MCLQRPHGSALAQFTPGHSLLYPPSLYFIFPFSSHFVSHTHSQLCRDVPWLPIDCQYGGKELGQVVALPGPRCEEGGGGRGQRGDSGSPPVPAEDVGRGSSPPCSSDQRSLDQRRERGGEVSEGKEGSDTYIKVFQHQRKLEANGQWYAQGNDLCIGSDVIIQQSVVKYANSNL